MGAGAADRKLMLMLTLTDKGSFLCRGVSGNMDFNETLTMLELSAAESF